MFFRDSRYASHDDGISNFGFRSADDPIEKIYEARCRSRLETRIFPSSGNKRLRDSKLSGGVERVEKGVRGDVSTSDQHCLILATVDEQRLRLGD